MSGWALRRRARRHRAKEIETDCHALRLTPDEWMVPLFADRAPRPFGPSLADGKRDVLEGRLVWLALRALQLGTNVVLDFGVWAKEERSALHHLALSARARFGLVYMQVDDDEQAGACANAIPNLLRPSSCRRQNWSCDARASRHRTRRY